MLNVFTLRKLFRLFEPNIEIVHILAYMYVHCTAATTKKNNKTISITLVYYIMRACILRCNYIGYSEYAYNKVYNAIHSVFVGPDDTNVLPYVFSPHGFYCIIFFLLFCSLNCNRLILMYEMFCLRFSRRWRMARHETFSILLK